MKSLTVRTYYVVCDAIGAERAAGETEIVRRFPDRTMAKAFAAGRMWQGRPAVVRVQAVPAHIAERWGLRKQATDADVAEDPRA